MVDFVDAVDLPRQGGPGPFCRLRRAVGADLDAERRGARWGVVFVDTGAPIDAARRERLEAALRLARRLGGDGEILRGHAIADELLACAEREGVGQIILGRTRERVFARMAGRSLTQLL